MARSAQHTVPRTHGPGSAAVWAVLLAVLVTLFSSSVLSSEHPRVSGGAVLTAEAESPYGPAHSGEPSADNADPAVSAAAVRSHRDVTGERHAPPLSTPAASAVAATGPLQPARCPVPAVSPPASEQPAHHHGVRGPPSLSGI
jgi:hypothetical protein